MSKCQFAGAAVALAIIAFFSSNASAANCTAYPYPYTLINGNTADANQVMGDFNAILNCANNNLAPLANPSFTGNVGIGTASPPAKLGVVGSAIFSGATPFIAFAANQSGTTPAFIQYDTTNGLMQIYSNGAERMRINSLGQVGIGTNSPAYPLHVNGNVAGTSFVTTSDARLKKNVDTVRGAIGLVQKLRGVRFNWRPVEEREIGKNLKLPTDERQMGFIAQEVAAIIPEAVVVPKKGSADPYSLKEENLIPLLVEAIKEQQAQIEQLSAKVAAFTRTSR